MGTQRGSCPDITKEFFLYLIPYSNPTGIPYPIPDPNLSVAEPVSSGLFCFLLIEPIGVPAGKRR
jgi:hypothetical protein